MNKLLVILAARLKFDSNINEITNGQKQQNPVGRT
jgi:hypothetical protein